MRLKYYKITIRQMKLKKAFVFFVFSIFFCYLLVYVFNKRIEPVLRVVCDTNAKSVAFYTSNNATLECIQNIKYEDLIIIDKNSLDNVTAIKANVSQINKLINEISHSIQEKIDCSSNSLVKLPLSEICGMHVLGASGPRIKVNTLIDGIVNVKFKSSFEDAGINQTRHSLYVEITTKVTTIAPFFEDENTYTNDILIAETIIISDVPSSYYEVNGVEGLDKKSVMDINENK